MLIDGLHWLQGHFGALLKAVFLNKYLSLSIKRCVYNACVLSVLLYGPECWTLSIDEALQKAE